MSYDDSGNRIAILRSPVRSWMGAFFFLLYFSFWNSVYFIVSLCGPSQYLLARVAQLVERGTSNAEVFSSNLDVSISFCINGFFCIDLLALRRSVIILFSFIIVLSCEDSCVLRVTH